MSTKLEAWLKKQKEQEYIQYFNEAIAVIEKLKEALEEIQKSYDTFYHKTETINGKAFVTADSKVWSDFSQNHDRSIEALEIDPENI